MKTSFKTIAIASILATSAVLVGCTTSASVPDKMAAAEQIFKDCEKQAKTSFAGSGDAGYCSENYEFLLKEKFGGDFNKMMQWWETDVKPFTQVNPEALKGKFSV